jgi:hypothetical protein
MVEYTDSAPALNAYPHRIVSPSRPSRCCTGAMALLGEELTEGRVIFRYKRCRHCGYTVRLIIREMPDPGQAEALRQLLAVAFSQLEHDPRGATPEDDT